MSYIRYNNAEGGTSGTTVTAANSGGASGYAIDMAAGGANLTFDNAQSFTGSQSYKFVVSGSSGYLQWAGSGTSETIYTRMYFRFATAVFACAKLINMSNIYYIGTTAAGKLQVTAPGGFPNGSYVIAADTWYRLEFQGTQGPSGTATYRLYDASGTLLETMTSPPASMTTALYAMFGLISVSTGTLWVDEPAMSNQGWIGTAVGSGIGALSKRNNALGGAPGGGVTSGNSGGAYGDAFDAVGGTAPTFSTTVLRPSGSIANYAMGTGSGRLIWNTPGTATDIYVRNYVYQVGAGNPSVVSLYSSSGSQITSSNISGSKIRAGAVTGTYTMSLSTWYRLETRFNIGASGYAEVYLYDMSGAQLDHVTSATSNTTAAAFIYFGFSTVSMYLDSLALSDVTWIGSAPNLPPYTLLDQLHDSHLDTTKWSGAYGTLSYGQNGVTITNPIGYTGYGGFNSIGSYDYTGWSAFTRCVSAGNQALASLQVFPLQLQLDSNNVAGFIISGGNVQAFTKIAGSSTYYNSATYVPATHLWFRIRESGGTTYWETSPDSQTWNAFYSAANPIAVTSLQFVISAGTYASEASATTVVIDMVNSPAAVLPVGGKFIRYNNAEGMPSGTTVTAANSGGTSGYAFDAVNGTVRFDNTQAFTGSQSYKFALTSANAWMLFTRQITVPANPGMVTNWSRFYFRYTGSPAQTTLIYDNNMMSVVLLSTGGLQVACNTATQNSTTILAADTWYRIETQNQMAAGSAANTNQTCRIYNAAGTLLETFSKAMLSTIFYTAGTWNWGAIIGSASSTTLTFWIDEPAISSAGWIGAATGSAVGPVSKANNAAGGVNGVALTTANTDGASGDAFDAAGTFAGALSYSWQNPRRGSSPLNYYSTGGGYYAGWNIPGNITNLYSRFYFFNQAGTNKTVFGIQTTPAVWAVVNTGVQKLAFSSAFVLNGTYTMAADTWYRLDIRWSQPASGIGFVECYLYDIDGNQLDHFIGLMTTIPAISVNRAIGYGGTVDSLAISDQGWIGPAADIPTITSRKGAMFMDVMG